MADGWPMPDGADGHGRRAHPGRAGRSRRALPPAAAGAAASAGCPPRIGVTPAGTLRSDAGRRHTAGRAGEDAAAPRRPPLPDGGAELEF